MSESAGIAFEYRVVPGLTSTVSLQGLRPHAVYELSHPDLDGFHELVTDAQGTARMQVHAHDGADRVRLALVEHGVNGAVTEHHSVNVYADPGYIEIEQPTPDRAVTSNTATVPALPRELISAANPRLLAQGYPPRPPKDAPAPAHARWARKVRHAWQRVDSGSVVPSAHTRFHRTQDGLPKAGRRLVESPTLPLPPPEQVHALTESLEALLPRHAAAVTNSLFNESGTAWSGAFVPSPGKREEGVWQVMADFRVPTQQPLTAPGLREVAVWLGMDNAGDDLFQSGVDCKQINGGWFSFTFYNLWIEVLPQLPWYIPDIPVSPGDLIDISIFTGDDSGQWWTGPEANRNTVMWFMVSNYTTHKDHWYTYPLSTDKYHFDGNSVEYILERPGHTDGSAWPLSHFCQAMMWNCGYMVESAGDWKMFGLGSEWAAYPERLFNLVSDDYARPLVFSSLITDTNSFDDCALLLTQTGYDQ